MYKKVSEPEWQVREKSNKLWKVEQKDIQVGGQYIYRGAHSITYGADYLAECIYLTDHVIGLRVTVDQGSSPFPFERFGIARSYVWSIPRRDLGKTERLYYRRR